jgi:hypothetical protein
MPMARATVATWAPILPRPTTPRVFLYTSTPVKALRFHCASFTDLSAAGMWRDRDSIMASACSAAAMVLPSGELTTTMPRRVAVGTSTLSTPTPARPMIFNCLPASMTAWVTWVPERIIRASYSGIALTNSSGESLVCTSTWATWERMSIPAWSMGSETRTLGMVGQGSSQK